MLMLVEELLRREYEEYVRRLNEQKDDKVITVTELCGCYLKREWARKFPLLAFRPVLMTGKIVHEGVERLLEELYGAKREVEVKRQVGSFTLVGRIDALGEDTVWEIKYVKDMREANPMEHHLMQLKLYMFLSNSKHGQLIYVSPTRVVEFTVHDPYDEREVHELIVEWHDWKACIPRWHWECKYCEYRGFCPRCKDGSVEGAR